MPRVSPPYTQAHLKRAIRAAASVGLATDHIAIKPDGTVIIMKPIGEALMPLDDLDRELAEFEAKNDQG